MANLFFLSGRAYEDANGNPYPGAKAYFFVTGTTTALDSYTSASLAVANANPVVSDSSTGIWGDIYLAAKRYKVRVDDASGNVLRTWDPVDATSQLIAAASAPSPTYPFLRYHNTTDGKVYRRNAADDAWIDEGAVDSLLNAASVTEQLTGTETAKSSTPDSVAAIWQRGTDITPSGGTVSLPSTGGRVFNIAAGNFSAISSGRGGREVVFEFAGVSVITHNASSLDLPGSVNITTAAGDRAAFVNLAAADAAGANWRCLWFMPDNGSPVALTNLVATESDQETGTSVALAVTPGRQHFHESAVKAWVEYDNNGESGTTEDTYGISSLTDNGVGLATPNYTTAFTSVAYALATHASSASGTAQAQGLRVVSSATKLAASVRFEGFSITDAASTTVDMDYNFAMFSGTI